MGDDAPYDPKIVHLPGTKLTPEVLLHRTLGKLARIKNVAIIIQWDDNTFDADWSSMTMSEFCMAAAILQMEAQDEMRKVK